MYLFLSHCALEFYLCFWTYLHKFLYYNLLILLLQDKYVKEMIYDYLIKQQQLETI